MTDAPNNPPADEQPEPEEQNARVNYQRATQRLHSLLRRKAKLHGAVDVLATEQDLAVRTCELAAMQALLIRAGIFDAEDLYAEAAIAAVKAGNRIHAELAAPDIRGADGQKLNGS